MYCEHTHVLRTHSMYLRTYMYLCTIQILIKSEFIVKPDGQGRRHQIKFDWNTYSRHTNVL